MPERFLLHNNPQDRRLADLQFREDLYKIFSTFDERLDKLEKRMIALTVGISSTTGIFGFVIGLVLEGKLVIRL